MIVVNGELENKVGILQKKLGELNIEIKRLQEKVNLNTQPKAQKGEQVAIKQHI